jgi:hypothetical protein
MAPRSFSLSAHVILVEDHRCNGFGLLRLTRSVSTSVIPKHLRQQKHSRSGLLTGNNNLCFPVRQIHIVTDASELPRLEHNVITTTTMSSANHYRCESSKESSKDASGNSRTQLAWWHWMRNFTNAQAPLNSPPSPICIITSMPAAHWPHAIYE